jgi:hypothetical protein
VRYVLIHLGVEGASISAKRSHYVSAYRSHSKSATSIASLSYDAYHFTRMTFSVDKECNVLEKVQEMVETILVARDWRKQIGKGGGKGGYLGSGMMKFAFEVRSN